MTKILFVDDEADIKILIQQKYKKQINDGSFHFEFASNGIEALETLENTPEIDIIFSDIHMEKMDGLTLLGEVRDRYPLKKVVIVTAYGDMSNIRSAMNQGAFDFIVKPINFRDLDITIQKTAEEVQRNLQWMMAVAENAVLKSYNQRLQNEINEREKIQNELNIVMKELKRSNEDLELFAYSVSHDLQEPLRMITSYLQLLQKRYQGNLDSDADEFIGYAVDGSHRMQKMISDLLGFSRIQTKGKPLIETDLNTVLNEAISNLSITIEETHTIIEKDELPTVNGDHSQLVSLFQNIISNAIKYRRKDIDPLINIRLEDRGKEWLILIEDNGIGIEEQYLRDIFKIFRRLHTRQDYPGTGIGLAICERIVLRHQGLIWVESSYGEGSCFHVILPKIN